MPQKPESLFRTKVRGMLKDVPNAWFETIQQKAIAGTPDIIGCVNGYFVALELKATPRDRLTPLQAAKMQLIVNANGLGFRVHPENVDELMILLKQLSVEDTKHVKAHLGGIE